MSLSDEVASHVLGEIFELTSHIDKMLGKIDAQTAALADTEQRVKSIVKTLENSASAVREAHEQHIAAKLVEAKMELTEHMATLLEEGKTALRDTAKTAAQRCVEKIGAEIKSKVDENLHGVDSLAVSAEKISKTLFIETDMVVSRLGNATEDYKTTLIDRAQMLLPTSVHWWALGLSVVSAVFAAILVALVFSEGFLPVNTAQQQVPPQQMKQLKSH